MIQAGLYPNPVVGYSAEEVKIADPSERAIHSVFVEQLIVTGGKLKRGKEVFHQEKIQASGQKEAQRNRVLTEVRIVYYRALGAQKRVDILGELADVAAEAVDITRDLYNVGQADLPDVLEAETVKEQRDYYQQSIHLLPPPELIRAQLLEHPTSFFKTNLSENRGNVVARTFSIFKRKSRYCVKTGGSS